MGFKKTLSLLFISLNTIITLFAQETSPFIIVDQFGYRTNDEKVAVIKNPQTGFDSNLSFTPGTSYSLIDATSNETIYTNDITPWNGGLEDSTSGDKAWWFDFSSVTTTGDYFVKDNTNNVHSYTFTIADDVYDNILKHAVRTFFYQRVGFAKEAPYAETGWTDGASHIGPLQDKNCRPYNDPNNASLEKDLSGGWYDAGDFNKYTIWTANYVYEMLQAYQENPNAWTDDYNLPESGNGIPDLIDEAKWGMDHLLRLQNTDGSIISIVSEDHASPPSTADGQSLYGDVNSSSAWSTASTFAYGAKVFAELGFTAYATTLQNAAINAYNWAEINPDVIWKNNDEDYNSKGIGSGQQETNEYDRLVYRIRANIHLFELTDETKYNTFVENNYEEVHLIPWYHAYPFEVREQEVLLYYTTLSNATSSVKNKIISRYKNAMSNNDYNLNAHENSWDPYMAPLENYVWGSNSTKAKQGTMFYDAILYNTNANKTEELKKAAQKYIHYIHGVNPLNLCYLSNMYGKGAENCVNQFYHTWFTDDSPEWDEVGVSTYGPAPGFLVGGPNPSYSWDDCCPNDCGGAVNNAACSSMDISPPTNQPAQKSYLDFNTSWPLNSWEVTENSCGYQIAYIRLLSKFVDRGAIINGTSKTHLKNELKIFPNPSNGTVQLITPNKEAILSVDLLDIHGKLIDSNLPITRESKLQIKHKDLGIYLIKVTTPTQSYITKIILE